MILISYGTRPEWIKLKPIIKLMKDENLPFKTLFTGQHKDLIEEKADFNFEINESLDNRLNDIHRSILSIDDSYFTDIDYILVQGDTSSALSLTINAFHRNIKIIHLEAGLRTYDFKNPYPEEMNRQLISRLADVHLCPTKLNKKNLIKEKCKGDIYVVGNTALDNIKKVKTSYKDIVVVTIHRRENHKIIQNWFSKISELALEFDKIEFIVPIHPNPNISNYKYLLKGVKIIEPLKSEEMIKLISQSKLIITDSGGLQEEGSFLNKKIIVCRKNTERPESLNIHSFLCENPDDLKSKFKELILNYKVDSKCPFGDGNSSRKIINILKKCCFK